MNKEGFGQIETGGIPEEEKSKEARAAQERGQEKKRPEGMRPLLKEFFSDIGVPPPIVLGEVFVPEEELRKVRKLTGEERVAELLEFKEKLAYQKVGLAKMQAQLVSEIRERPEAFSIDVDPIISEFAKRYGFTEEQIQTAHALITGYQEKHRAVRSAAHKYGIDRAEDEAARETACKELYKEAFGREPAGRIEIIQGPMTLYFRCFDEEDYAWIYSQAFTRKDPKLLPEDKIAAHLSGGVSISRSLIPGLGGALIAENTAELITWRGPDAKKIEEQSRLTHIHEEQHAIKRLFRDVQEEAEMAQLFDAILQQEEMLKKATPLGQDLRAPVHELKLFTRELKLLVERRYRYERKMHEPRTKDEILAYMQEGRDAQKVEEILLRPKERGGLYDYFEEENERRREILLDFGLGLLKKTLPLFGKMEKTVSEDYKRIGRIELKALDELKKRFVKILPLFGEAKKRVFEDEYKKLIHDGLETFSELKNSGYSTEQVIGLLVHEPLGRWKKVAKRLREGRQ